MKVAYGVRWRDALGDVEGRLSVGPQSLRLMDLTGGRVPLREIPLDAISGLELTSINGWHDRPILVFQSSANGRVEVESAVGKWILGDVLDEMQWSTLDQAPVRHRVLISIKTKPECRERVAELLKEGPPFDPIPTPITRHDVFVLDDEVLFLFETDDRLEAEDSLLDAWRWAESWRDLAVGVRSAEQVFSWIRPAASEPVASHLGSASDPPFQPLRNR
jgi:hypothetical protein